MVIGLFVLTSANTLHAKAISIQNKKYYTFTYIVSNPSLGPVTGTSVTTVHIHKNKISAINMVTGERLKEKNIPYKQILLETIMKKTGKYQIEYDSHHFPKKITLNSSSNILGQTIIIKILSYKIVNDSYVLDGQKLRKDYFKINYQKWLSLENEEYIFNYQDSKLKKSYIDGIEVSIKDNKVISLKDIYHSQFIDLSNKNKVRTINQLFNLTKRRLYDNKMNKLSVLYDIQYGYPYYIKNEKIEIFLHSLKIIKKGKK